MVVNGKEIAVFHEKDPAAIKWGETGAEYVCESTGHAVSHVPQAARYLHDAGEGRVASGRRRQESHHLCAAQGETRLYLRLFRQ